LLICNQDGGRVLAALIVLWSGSVICLIYLTLALHLGWNFVIDKGASRKRAVTYASNDKKKGGDLMNPADVTLTLTSRNTRETLLSELGTNSVIGPGGASLALAVSFSSDLTRKMSYAAGASHILPSRRDLTQSFTK
jgi:hypothetical protein